MRITVPLGNEEVEIYLPEDLIVNTAKPLKPILAADDEGEEIKRALMEPIGSPTLLALASKAKKVIILISDYTRPTPSKVIVPHLINELINGGIKDEDISVIFCAGLHRPTTKDEMRKILGDEIFDRYTVVSHDAEASEYENLGFTSRGTPIEINKLVADADLKISVSTIEPHHAAGWSGGGKNVVPGVSSAKAIMKHHSQMLLDEVGIDRLDGNPFREDIDEYSKRVGLDFILNVILSNDKRVAKAVAGDVVEAHRAGVEFARAMLTVNVPMSDLVIVAPGGHPRDTNLWQSEGKALTRIPHAVKENGIVILFAECPEGVGNENIVKHFISEDAEEVINEIRKLKFSIPSHKAFRIARLMKRATIFVVCSTKAIDDLKRIPLKYYSDGEQAIKDAIGILRTKLNKKDIIVTVVPNAPAVLVKAD